MSIPSVKYYSIEVDGMETAQASDEVGDLWDILENPAEQRRGVGESGRPRRVHVPKIVRSNRTAATNRRGRTC